MISFSKFKKIGQYIRFDRREQRQNQKDAPISIIWSLFTANCQRNYKPSPYLTIDEQLCNTRGRCPFKSYIPTKPGKYGIKIWCLCDSTNAYFLNGQIYTGRTGNSTEKNQGERVVRELSLKYLNTGRNITTDNFFTTLPLAKFLFSKKTTLVGTVRKTRKFLPEELCGNSRVVGSEFIFHENHIAIVRYTERPSKSVTLLSSFQPTNDISANGKPVIVETYNSTKAGVDTLDQLVRFYTVRRRTRRWPLTIFFNILDIACYNSLIVYLTKFPEVRELYKNRTRRKFIVDLADEIKDKYGQKHDDHESSEQSAKLFKYERKRTKRCVICPRVKDMKPCTGCDMCQNACCKSHLWQICENCVNNSYKKSK